MRADLRNLISIPRSRTVNFSGSNVLDLALASRSLYAVNANSIVSHAFPCCVRGGECCPADGQKRAASCCFHWRVQQWMNRTLWHVSPEENLIMSSTRSSWYDQPWRTYPVGLDLRRFSPHELHLDLQRQDAMHVAASTIGRGFSYYQAPNETEVRRRRRQRAYEEHATRRVRQPSASASQGAQ